MLCVLYQLQLCTGGWVVGLYPLPQCCTSCEIFSLLLYTSFRFPLIAVMFQGANQGDDF